MAQRPLDHQALFNRRLLDRNLPALAVPAPHQQLLDEWAGAIRDGSIRQRGERQIRGPFIRKFFVELLGYQPFGSAAAFTVTDEARTGAGSADVALGHFGPSGDVVVAPVELKGASTSNLDVVMPGRYKSPVQQVWEYAMDTPNAKFLVLSNMLELRLYAVGHTRQVYERFDLLDVANDPREYHRLQLLLGADNLLSGRTARLLQESAQAQREIIRQLYADYKRWRIQLIVALAHANELTPGELIAPAQKLLDRVLFVAFAQQRGLLPANTLHEVHATHNPWAPKPRYDNYKGLFRAIDKGLPARQIPPYNGGLFALDILLDERLSVPDAACDVFQEFSRYDFGGEVSVNVLGHIFEQSITDLEELQALAETGAFTLEAARAKAQLAPRAVSGARKEQGIVYTPEFVTGFIVEQTLGKTLQERRQLCSERYEICSTSRLEHEPAWRKATAEEKKYAAKSLVQPERVVELAFWRAWLVELTSIKVCDPACGSGAFLVAAFDVLLAEYNNVNEQIAAITGSLEVFNADREILNGNLFGVDLNAESIEITKLSLWLKTAKHGKPLESLEANLRVGNSIISSADGGLDYDAKAFDWTLEFPGIVSRGGFDVIIGNPPYVRMERLKAIKPYLEKRYEVATDRADLYCYFFELGLRLLRNGNAGGRIGFISSGTFFKTGSGDKLRGYMLANAQLESVVDFGDLQVFEGVTTYPAIVVARRAGEPQADEPLRFLNCRTELPNDLSKTFAELAEVMPQGQLSAEVWQFEGDALSKLRRKLRAGHPTLREVYGAPLYGVKTGLNEAFVISRAERDTLIARDAKSAELLTPFLRGKDLAKWHATPRDMWLIYIPKGRIAIDDYPAVKAHLMPFKDRLEKRATPQAWFELQQAQAAYAGAMQAEKICYVDMSEKPNFSLDRSGSYLANTVYFIGSSDGYLLALLCSQVLWRVATGMATQYSGGYFRLFTQYVEQLPIPNAPFVDRKHLGDLAAAAQCAAEARHAEVRRFGHRVMRDLAPGGTDGGATLGDALNEGVPSFATFTAELKKRFKRDLNLTERNDWEAEILAARERIAAHEARIACCERDIDAIVYRLFDLTPAEIALIEAK